jgi:hypothetical protein
MAKKLSDVLAGTNKSRTRPGSTGTRPGVDYASKMEDERNFVASHEVQEFDDRVGNESDVYNATNIKHAPDKKHGNIPKPEDEKQYKQANEETMTSSPRPVPRPGRTLPSGGYQYPNGAVEPGPGFRPLSTDTGSANTESGMTTSQRPKPRPAGLGSNSSSNTSMSDTYSTRPKPRPVFAEAKKEYEEDATDEKEMMMNQLNFIKLASEKIKGHIISTKDPEEWFQNKLSGIHANMKDLHAYAAGEKEVKEEAEQIDELDKKTLGSYAKKAKDDLGNRESEITRNRYVDPKGVKDPIKHNNSLLMKRAKRRDFINTAIDKMTKEEVEGDPRVEPKDVKSKGKSLKMITGQVKESNYNGSRTKTGTEQARARFDKKMERKEMQKDQEDDN